LRGGLAGRLSKDTAEEVVDCLSRRKVCTLSWRRRRAPRLLLRGLLLRRRPCRRLVVRGLVRRGVVVDRGVGRQRASWLRRRSA
jgi:hypothetical protein